MEKKFALGDVVYVKCMITAVDNIKPKYWVDFLDNGAECGDWCKEKYLIPASEIENYRKSSLEIWDLAARVAGLPQADFEAIFGEDATVYGVFKSISPVTVERKINEYEQSKIRIGDLVEIGYNGGEKTKVIYAGENRDYYYFLIHGYDCVQKWDKQTCVLTKLESNKVDILGALENIKEN